MTINTTTLNRHGQIDRLLQAIKHWDILREAQAFTEEQKQRLKDPQSEWHLQKVDEKNYQLYPLFVSKRYYCNLRGMLAVIPLRHKSATLALTRK